MIIQSQHKILISTSTKVKNYRRRAFTHLSGEITCRDAPPKGAVEIGDGHTHGAGDEVDLGNGKFSTGQDSPSDYGNSGDIDLSIKSSKENPNFEGDVVITSSGYVFIYGPGTKNGTDVKSMKPDSTNVAKDPYTKKNPNNKNTQRFTPVELPKQETKDGYVQKPR